MSLLDAPYRYTALQKSLLAVAGLVVFLLVWWLLAEQLSIQQPVGSFETRLPSSLTTDSTELARRDSIIRADSIAYANATEFKKVYPLLPPPGRVFSSFGELVNPPPRSVTKGLFANAGISIWRNLQGYFWAVFFSLLIGIPVAVSPLARAMFSRQIDTLRYVPLTALTPLFLIAFDSTQSEALKVSFLAFGILVYLLPVVMQRLWETEDVYLKTAFTLGASDWQLIKSVYLPSVLSKLIDDIRVLTAISWTYIIIAESINRDEGLGSMLYILARQGNIAGAYAVLIFIVVIGFTQDQLFAYMNRRLFPHKDVKSRRPGLNEVRTGFLVILGVVMGYLLLQLFTGTIPILGLLVALICAAAALLIIYGEFRLRRPLTP
jgi:NitT/TauT family transport system permease protein